jgi:hypothetical protein
MSKSEPIQTLEQLAETLIERRMAAPAIFMLELCKPLVGCARELYDATESLQRVLLGQQLMPAIREVLSSSERVEELIGLLEQRRVGTRSRGARPPGDLCQEVESEASRSRVAHGARVGHGVENA